MKEQRTRKLFVFSTIIVVSAAILFFNSSCQKGASADSKEVTIPTGSTIIYTDVNPDSTFTCSNAGCTQMFNLDLDKDGISDYKLVVHVYYPASWPHCLANNEWVHISPLDSSGILGAPPEVIELNAKAIINNKSIFDTAKNQLLAQVYQYYNSRSNFCNAIFSGNWQRTDGYIGLQLKKAGHIYFGWVHISVSITAASASFTVQDYAYNSIPNQPILAGQTK